MYIGGDDDIEIMLDTHKVFVGELPSLESYVEVMRSTFDLNIEMLPSVKEAPLENSNFICSPTVREIPVKKFTSSNGYCKQSLTHLTPLHQTYLEA